MIQKVGIDAGGTLTKIAYQEAGKLHVKMYSNQKLKQVIQWLQMNAPNAMLNVTGGKAEQVRDMLLKDCQLVDEFQATVDGAKFLLEQEQDYLKEEFLLVSMGTGTSIFYVNANTYERLLGSGIGGGTLMGLGFLLTGEERFQLLVEMANQGKRASYDLLVKDIYDSADSPLLGDLTAANFGKSHFSNQESNEDKMASLVQMIGEAVVTLACQAAALKQVQKIVFVGSTLNGNHTLKNVLTSFQNLYPYDPVFLDKGSYSGAIGALLHK